MSKLLVEVAADHIRFQSKVDFSAELEKFGSHSACFGILLIAPCFVDEDWLTGLTRLAEIFSGRSGLDGPGSAPVLQIRRSACREFQNSLVFWAL